MHVIVGLPIVPRFLWPFAFTLLFFSFTKRMLSVTLISTTTLDAIELGHYPIFRGVFDPLLPILFHAAMRLFRYPATCNASLRSKYWISEALVFHLIFYSYIQYVRFLSGIIYKWGKGVVAIDWKRKKGIGFAFKWTEAHFYGR